MEFDFSAGPLPGLPGGCIVAGVHPQGRLSAAAQALDAASGGALTRVLAAGDLDGQPGSSLLLHSLPGLACERVLLLGLGPPHTLREHAWRRALEAAAHALCATGAAQATLCLPPALPAAGRDAAWCVEQAVRVLDEACYRFDRLKSRPPPRPALARLALHLGEGPPAAAAAQALARGRAIAAGVALARDLGNLPGNLCTPGMLAAQAQALGEQHGLAVEVLEEDAMRRLGMGGLLAVARGSREPPRLISMAWRGGAAGAPPVVLVGKGITFDSGGLSIKAATAMEEMKFDMCGAASVYGAVHAAALLRLPLNIVGMVPAAENMPDGNATRPGDVVGTLSGLSVEILDTDSEGRLVLCDALAYARRLQPAALVDVATLTGEIVKALGEAASGLFANDEALAQQLLEAGERAWDRAWRMPLWEDYQDALQSNFADLPNIGSQADSAPVAACFLSRFTQGCAWAHLDVAGTASRSGADKGATGRPVALLVHFLEAWAAAQG